MYAGGADGLFRIDTESGVTEEVQSFSMVRGLYVDAHQRIWVGHQRGLDILGDGETIHLDHKDGLINEQVLDILPLDSDRTLLATFDGVGVVRNDRVESFVQEADYLPGATIKVLFKDSRDYLWYGAFSSVGGGVACQRGDQVQVFNAEQGLVHNNVTTIVETTQGQVLVGAGLHTKGGANRLIYDNGQWEITQTYTKADGLAGEKVRMIYIDDLDHVWFCSEYDGIAIFKEDKPFMYLNEATGLTQNEVKRIVKDQHGNLWLATKSGITWIPLDWLMDNHLSMNHK